VIDDALVVVGEHLSVHRGGGSHGHGGGGGATREIGLAVMATTLSLVVIFLPVAFMQGRIAVSSSSSALPRPAQSLSPFWWPSRSRRCCAPVPQGPG